MTPRERADMFALRFRGQANHLAFQFGGPLYLVGSYLHAELPGDIDLRLLIAREDADLWFGKDADGVGILSESSVADGIAVDWNTSSLARCREELKVSRRMTKRWRPGAGTRLRIDFQFQITLFNDAGEPINAHGDKPRIRLDAVPLEMLRAGRGDP